MTRKYSARHQLGWRQRLGCVRALFGAIIFLLSPSANALKGLPAKWEYGNGTSDGYSTCLAAAQAGMAASKAILGVELIEMSGNRCIVDASFSLFWQYRRVDDFPTTPNRQFEVGTYCPRGYAIFQTTDPMAAVCIPNGPPETMNIGLSCTSCVGNPIFPGYANKLERELDYVGAGAYPLRFERIYNSKPWVTAPRLGVNWWHTYHRKVTFGPNPSNAPYVGVDRPDGRVLAYELVGSTYVGDANTVERLERLTNGWKLTNGDDEVELYDNAGKLLSISNRQGLAHTLTYFTDGLNAGRIQKVSDSFGRTLTFEYDYIHITALLDPDGGRYVYSYSADEYNNLVGVTYPDGKKRIYHYELNSRNLLTGITDEKGQRFASFGYDHLWRPNVSEHAGGVGKVTIDYSSSGVAADVTTQVNSTQSATRTYTYQVVQGVFLNNGITGPACPSCGPASRIYDANGNVTTQSDWNGFKTHVYSYDLSRNLELIRGEGNNPDGASVSGITQAYTTQWHPAYRLPIGVAQPLRITTMTYGEPTDPNPGNRGNLLTKTIQATTSLLGGVGFAAMRIGTPRTWAYTYNANGQVLTIEGPRTDVSDLTTHTYYANDAICAGSSPIGCRGQLESITNVAGHVTRVSEYNTHGQPLAITDPNGLTTKLTYDLRQRLTSRSVGGETTAYDYDEAGQLIRVTLPDGSYIVYTYDAAHRLTAIADGLGNRIAYTLDLAGNRTRERVFDPANQLLQTRSRVYDNLSRLVQEIGAVGQTITYGYDNQGNVTSTDGPLAGTVDVTTNAYDQLHRLTRATDPHSGQVRYAYNGLNQLVSVTDPRNLTTTYNYDGLNNLNQQVSPDTGTATNTYDAAGNLLTQTDAKGQVTQYGYDALNRVTSISFHDGSTQAYVYDQGVNGFGRLTGVIESDSSNQVTGAIQYRYDLHGRVESEIRTINGVPYTTGYGYDGAGRLNATRYPSGRVLAYGYDALGRVNQISTTVNDQSQVVVQNVQYWPFGGVAAFTLGNGQTYSRGRDQDGRIANYTLGAQTFAVGYDPANRITSLNDLGSPANASTYGYDNLDRLTSALVPGTAFGYSYDAVGNRLSKSAGSSNDLYGYGTSSNRLSFVTPNSGPLRSYLHDANGSVTADGVNNYAYDARGRLAQASSAIGATTYQVNALGQRVRKTSALGDIVFHYDVQGRLISESTPGGQVRKEYLYLGDIPVAVIQ